MGKHVPALDGKNTHKLGCATKHSAPKGDRCDYRHNGYEETDTVDTKKAIYNKDFTKKVHAQRLPSTMQEELKLGHKERDKRGRKIKKNFRTPDNPGLTGFEKAWFIGSTLHPSNYRTAYLPFNHNYHHILPDTSLAVLDEYILKLLQSTGYNLNGKLNMIILPCTLTYGIALLLPDHPGGHPDYNTDVTTVVEDISTAVKQTAPSHRITNDNKDALRKKLESWQKREFKKIVEYGETLTPAVSTTNLINDAPIATALTR